MEKQQKKKPRIAKTNLYNKGTSRWINIPNLKLYYKATLMKTSRHKNSEVDQWNQIEELDINPHTPEHLIFGKKNPKII